MATPEWVLERIAENLAAQEPVLDLNRTKGFFWEWDWEISLTEIPPEVFQLTHLRELWLYDQGIQVVPARLAELPLLEIVDLRKNPLLEIADVPGLVLNLGLCMRLCLCRPIPR